ncbi:hypothetical protein L0F63_000949 [Massospora cicadina]|nr:hypothetical protein L0F63_000949 [Massospora cicadina]
MRYECSLSYFNCADTVGYSGDGDLPSFGCQTTLHSSQPTSSRFEAIPMTVINHPHPTITAKRRLKFLTRPVPVDL